MKTHPFWANFCCSLSSNSPLILKLATPLTRGFRNFLSSESAARTWSCELTTAWHSTVQTSLFWISLKWRSGIMLFRGWIKFSINLTEVPLLRRESACMVFEWLQYFQGQKWQKQSHFLLAQNFDSRHQPNTTSQNLLSQNLWYLILSS